jgi:hypothetical protein
MRLERLRVYFETSPALRLLRSPNAPFIIDFLGRQFKRASTIAIPHSDLYGALIAYQEEVHESYPEELTSLAEAYLVQWCSSDTLWLRRFLEAGRNEPVYQLTPDTEDVFVFLDRVLEKELGFVGTESRLKLITDTLSDLVVGSSDDPESRLAHLQEERERIQSEIARIEADGCVTKYQPAQIRERFGTAVSLLRQLQGDFRAVEESFRKITAQVQQRQVEGHDTRGGILEFALDAEDLLKKQDQGVSFYEFVKLILSPSHTERLERIIQEVRKIPELQTYQDGLETIRGMVTLLQSEADKVMRTNQRLSATLRTLLDARASAERQQIARLFRQICSYAAALSERPRYDEVRFELELEPEIESPFRRTFWSEPPHFERTNLTDFEPDGSRRHSAFQDLAALQRLDWKEMRHRITRLVGANNSVTLSELLRIYPPYGVIEILGYLQIAREDEHLVSGSATEQVLVPATKANERAELVTMPLVTFTHSRRSLNDRRPS